MLRSLVLLTIVGLKTCTALINGTEASITESPYQVSLQYGNYHGCGGALISPKYVVTAAHCLKTNPPVHKISVRLGSDSWKRNGQLVNVVSYKTHPDYLNTTHNMDVAIVELATPARIDNRTIKVIELSSEEPTEGTDVVVTGWGVVRRGAFEYKEHLGKINLKIVSRDFCKSKYDYGTGILESMICAFEKKKDTCEGDSGGPLVANGKLVGIVSWGVGCAILDYPGVYTKVAHVKTWIEDNAKGQ